MGLEGSKLMIFKNLEFNEEEIIQCLQDAGMDVFTPDDIEFNNHPTMKEQMDWIETRLRAINTLFRVVGELDAREFSNNCVVPELQALSWNEVCDQGIALLQELKNDRKEIR